MKDIIRDKLYLAALLHDIGKFYQRADEGSSKNSRYLSESVRQAEQIHCPESASGGYRTHKHVQWTAQFFEDHQPVFRELLGREGVSELQGGDTLARLSAVHHLPSSSLEKLVQLADWCASGVDRTKDTGKKDGEAEHKWDSFKKVRMRSVFESIHREGKDLPNLKYSLPLDAPDSQRLSFPQPDKSFQEDPEYAVLWKAFEEDFRLLKAKHIHAFADSLLFLLEKYTSRIPSSTMHLPDVSLFHHLKTTAALALCFYDYEQEKKVEIRAEKEVDSLLLIGADLSGIQSYIYDIVSRYASKNLKGRSFWLQLLLDSVLENILDQLGLFRANVVYASGGGFFLLAPNTEKVREALLKIEQDLQEKLFDAYQGKLYLALAWQPHSANDLLDQKLAEVWKGLMDQLNQKKRQRFSGLMISRYASFFEPDAEDALPQRDQITGEGLHGGDAIRYPQGREEQIVIHPDTKRQIELGTALKAANFWVTASPELSSLGQKSFEPGNLGVHHYFLSAKQVAEKEKMLRGSMDGVLIRKINDHDFLGDSLAGNANTYGFVSYGGNDFPAAEDGSPKTFNALAGSPDEGESESDESQYARLGVLRMDVDNLGQIFINGLSETRRTYSRYSSLSSSLDQFFKGYINHLWEKEKYKGLTQIIYSGGDDLFIVGRWHLMIDLADEIQQDFRKWTCENEHLSISAGIAIIPPKYPVSKGAELAAAEETRAKDHTYHLGKDQKLEKNAISFMGVALHWQHEFPLVRELKDLLLSWIQGDMPKSILGRIRAHYRGYHEAKEHKTAESWRWIMAYDFARLSKRIKSETIRKEVEEVKTAVFTERYGRYITANDSDNKNHSMIELLNLAARWAELEERSVGNEK